MGLASCADGSNGADGARSTDEGAAISSARNYSVDLEEQGAESFNLAVRAYKARQKNN